MKSIVFATLSFLHVTCWSQIPGTADLKIPLILQQDPPSNFYYFRYANSNLAELKFTLDELENAKVFSDSVFSDEGEFLYLRTDIQINSEKQNKLIGVTINRTYISEIYETLHGNKIKLHQEFNVIEFNEEGEIIDRRREYLY